MPSYSDRALRAARSTLAKIAAYDPYFANPSKAMWIAWAEHITLRNMQEEEMLEAVAKFYESNSEGFKPLPATISTIAIELRRSRPESDGDRELREARIDAKVEGRVQDLDAPILPARVPAEKITLEEWQRRHGEEFPVLGFSVNEGKKRAAPLKVRCPWCKQPPGRRCTAPGTAREIKDFHDARVAVVEQRCAWWAGLHVSPHTEGCEGFV